MHCSIIHIVFITLFLDFVEKPKGLIGQLFNFFFGVFKLLNFLEKIETLHNSIKLMERGQRREV